VDDVTNVDGFESLFGDDEQFDPVHLPLVERMRRLRAMFLDVAIDVEAVAESLVLHYFQVPAERRELFMKMFMDDRVMLGTAVERVRTVLIEERGKPDSFLTDVEYRPEQVNALVASLLRLRTNRNRFAHQPMRVRLTGQGSVVRSREFTFGRGESAISFADAVAAYDEARACLDELVALAYVAIRRAEDAGHITQDKE
jgi:hypothetical protein